MESALGPPAMMVARKDELTPMMRQYFELCRRYDDALVLFQVGDFYETFCEAAELTARILEITLTSRKDSTGEYPMAGIPVDSAASYVETLLEAGYRVAIADQVEEPGESAGIVDRAVTRVITPGTLTEDELLSSDDNTFVAALVSERADTAHPRLGLALLDVSTGDFLTTSARSRGSIEDELSRFAPAEAILGPEVSSDLVPSACMVTPFSSDAFEHETARELLAAYVGEPEAILANECEVRACGAVLAYAEHVRGGPTPEMDGENDSSDASATARPRLEYVTRLRRYDPREYLLLDAVALRSLEVFEPRSVHGHEEATLVGVLDETASALGGRKLKDWLRRPLLEPDRIESRLDAVEALAGAVRTRESLHDQLRGIYDLERLIGRVSRERATARDLRSLHDTLAMVPEIRDILADIDCERLQTLRESLDPLTEVRTLIDQAIVEEPPHEITEGGIIADGYNEALDALRTTARDGKQWIDDLEAHERERTGIDSLKVGYNSVHGYYIEVTNPNLEAVPENYQRRQTLKRAERFVTPELKRREETIVGAEARADQREYDLFCDVRREVATEVERVQSLADALATLDVFVSLATVAAEHDYCRPQLHEVTDEAQPRLEITGGRHPVVERTQESFVPNDTRLDGRRRLAVITGPNMSGKSTYMRQVAQLVVLAQIGSFVPAARAELTPLERIFTRVGASDDIAGGRSTFMIEMDELATILREASADSLVLLDEVGRGTSTADGLAIAQAITEHLHDECGALTLFATHHHPLTALTETLEAAFTLHFEATQTDGEVVFDHHIAPGAAEGSYGVEVATAAGVPDSVVERSRTLLERQQRAATETTATPPVSSDGGDDPTDIVAELRALELAHMTPVEALTALDRLQRSLEE